MATLPCLLFVMFVSVNNYLAIKREHRVTSNVLCSDRFSVLNTTRFTPLKNDVRQYPEFLSEYPCAQNRRAGHPLKTYNYETLQTDHEQPKEISTHANYPLLEKLAKPPFRQEFVPTKQYAQVRASHLIKRVPKEEILTATESQENEDDSTRLREVITNKKIATIYTEEGYEDSAYDHGGRRSNADFHEGFAGKFRNKLDKMKYSGPAEKKNPSPSIVVDSHSNDYNTYPKESRLILQATNRKERKLPKYKKMFDKSLQGIFNQKLGESRTYPKFIIQDGISRLQEGFQDNDAKEENISKIQGKRKSNTNNKTEMDILKIHHLSGHANRFKKQQNCDDDIDNVDNASNKFKLEQLIASDLVKIPKRQSKHKKQKCYTNTRVSTKNRNRKNSFVLETNLNASQVSDKTKKTVHMKPDSIISPHENYKDIKNMLATEISKIVENDDLPYELFKKQKNHRGTMELKEETTIQPEAFTLEGINSRESYSVVTLKEKNLTMPNILVNSITTESTNNVVNLPILVSKNLHNPFPFFSKPDNSVDSSEAENKLLFHENSKPTNESLLNDSDEKHRTNLNLNSTSVQKETIKIDNFNESLSALNDPLLFQNKSEYDHNPFLIDYARSSDKYIPQYTILYRNQPEMKTDKAKFGRDVFRDSKGKKILSPPLSRGNTPKLTDQNNKGRIRSIKNNMDISLKTPNFVPSKLPSPSFFNAFSNNNYLSRFNNVPYKNIRPKESRHRLPFDFLDTSITLNNDRFLKKHFPLSKQFLSNFHSLENQKGLFNTLRLHPPALLNKNVYFKYLVRKKRSKYNYEYDINNTLNYSPSKMAINKEKYPFYRNYASPRSKTLKYITNPEQIPRKTIGGMEFYNSRDYLNCDDIDPDLEDVLPKEEKPAENQTFKTKVQKLDGLGEKLDCLKAKYYDDNPLDNPLFLESRVEQPILRAKFNTSKFVSRILSLLNNKKH